MPFTFSPNETPADFGVAQLDLKTKLKAAGWTLIDSGDGTGGNYSVGVDQLTTSAPGFDAVANSIINRFAWWLIRDPGGVREILFQHGNAGNGIDQLRIMYSASAKFIGTKHGVVSATIPPSAADERLIHGAAHTPLAGDPWAGTLVNPKWDYAIGDAAEGYSFYAFGRFNVTGIYNGGMFFDSMANDVGQPHPTIIGCIGNNANYLISGQIFDGRTFWIEWEETNISTHYCWGWPGASGGADKTGMCHHHVQRLGGFDDDEVMKPLGSNPYDGNEEVLAPVFWGTNGRLDDFGPRVASPGRVAGESRLWMAVGSEASPNAMDTDAGLTRAYIPGGLWLKWDGATAPVL